jgi:hypothetical protein
MIAFEHPYFLIDGEKFFPAIYDGGVGETIPPGFNAVRIPLDGTMRSDLRWNAAFEEADRAGAKGLKVLWDIDLGLFSRLPLPLADETQFRTLDFATHHLLKQIRERFLPLTLGVVLYRGGLDFSVGFPWEPEGRTRTQGFTERALRLDCRNHCLGYLRQLIVGWPDTIQSIVLLDATRLRHALDVILLADRQRYHGFAVAIKGTDVVNGLLGWDRASPHGVLARKLPPITEEPPVSIALCLPQAFPQGYDFSALEATVATWMREKRAFRVVTEEFLTVEWDGLDHIVVDESTLTPSGIRKLQGFRAAGGTTPAVRSRNF